MVSYTVLARKYRPSNLVELRGQEIFVRILNNAIKHNKLAHAYLLTGIRGVGKTSIARIIAKTINCEAPKLEGELIVPCTQCKSCKLVESGKHSDILEFDAASNTSVNDIREVIDSVHYAAMFSKYKVYIIDEVHMLSNSAFNALLKILEEPPHNIVFIFATTEIRKVPLTIISRCQKFDLHRFSVENIRDHLQSICSSEKINFEKEALDIVARHSGGSMRDALTMLESIIVAKQDVIDSKLVREVLGINDIEILYSLVTCLLEGNSKKSISLAQEIYTKGNEAADIVSDLMVIATKASKYIASNKDDQILELLDNYEKDLLKKLCSSASLVRLTTIWQILFKGIKELKFIEDTLSALEMLTIRCCYASSLPSFEDVLNSSGNKDLNENTNTILESNISENKYSFEDIIKIFVQNKEMIIYHQLRSEVNCHEIVDNKLVVSLDKNIDKDFIAKCINGLNKFTLKKWIVEVSNNPFNKEETVESKELYKVRNHVVIKEILQEFPGTKIKSITELTNN